MVYQTTNIVKRGVEWRGGWMIPEIKCGLLSFMDGWNGVGRVGQDWIGQDRIMIQIRSYISVSRKGLERLR